MGKKTNAALVTIGSGAWSFFGGVGVVAGTAAVMHTAPVSLPILAVAGGATALAGGGLGGLYSYFYSDDKKQAHNPAQISDQNREANQQIQDLTQQNLKQEVEKLTQENQILTSYIVSTATKQEDKIEKEESSALKAENNKLTIQINKKNKLISHLREDNKKQSEEMSQLREDNKKQSEEISQLRKDMGKLLALSKSQQNVAVPTNHQSQPNQRLH